MDRFFSKLDLRDIRIDPEAKFPPDAEEFAEDEPTIAPAPADWQGNGVDRLAETQAVAPAPNGGRLPQRNGEVLKVSARSRPSAVAGAIAGVVRESGRAEVQA